MNKDTQNLNGKAHQHGSVPLRRRRSIAAVVGWAILAQAAMATPAAPLLRTNSNPFFKTEDCYRQHFPLALKVANKLIPPEVRLFCAAPWNFAAFASVRNELQKREFDLVETIVRSTPPPKRPILREALLLAQSAASSGPPNMDLVWFIQKTLPYLHALHFHTSDEALVVRTFSAPDLVIMRAAARAINWKQAAFAPSSPPVRNLGSGKSLADVPAIILNPTAAI